MLRRFEIYSLAPDAPAASVAAFSRAARDCSLYIPEVLHSAIGINRSDVPLHFVWEHAYASPDAYVRYMEHPFHCARLDRFLMADQPERITSDNGYGVGLIGYSCETPVYYLERGARRVVALKLRDGAETAFADLAARAPGRDGMILSTFHDNSFASRWADGATVVSPPPRFDHLWEQGFATIAEALADPGEWRREAAPLIEEMIEVVYEIEPGFGYRAAA